jgi:subtilisin-like proprotein convertase family protein
VQWSQARVLVTDDTGESLLLGPAYLDVSPLSMRIPASGSTNGPAERYPATLRVFNQPTNLTSVQVTLYGLTHSHPTNLDILLVSPLGKPVMLMSGVGGTNTVTSATLVYLQSGSMPPSSSAIPSGVTSSYEPSNFGLITQLPQLGTNSPPNGPYSTSPSLDDLSGDDPNGIWKLYIYNNHQGGVGQLYGSWKLDFTFQ